MNDLNSKFSKVTPSKLIEVYNEKGYPISSKVGYPNLFGVRCNTNVPNRFDDIIGYFMLRSDGGYEMNSFDGTTDPGLYWLKNPMNVKGTAIMCPGSYLAYKIGLHKGQYTAYVQRGEIKVWRDNNKNSVLDFSGRTDEGYFGKICC